MQTYIFTFEPAARIKNIPQYPMWAQTSSRELKLDSYDNTWYTGNIRTTRVAMFLAGDLSWLFLSSMIEFHLLSTLDDFTKHTHFTNYVKPQHINAVI